MGRRSSCSARSAASPLGLHHKGRVKIHWDLKVNGHLLKAGRYAITLRALDKHRNVLGTTKTVVIALKR